ncbi:hypothetical protein [Nocardia miyunensis]|uniref:hypothetical protein n=1 Tax=Nocardia miyunensis TaxID=282684 RepID=UPI0008326A2D|nr:hypothetical protein [Nocardia miyunensis]
MSSVYHHSALMRVRQSDLDRTETFPAGVRALVAREKPVAITGFGTATWHGAADVASRSNEIVEYDPRTGDPCGWTAFTAVTECYGGKGAQTYCGTSLPGQKGMPPADHC